MTLPKVMSIVGTRPEAIKMAPLIRALRETGGVQEVLCLTAQHREMLDQVLSLFNLTAHYDLDIMKERQSLTYITTRALEGLEEIVRKEQPQLILVQGDTTTTLAGSLAAFYHKIPLGHVEAGLRTGDKYAPFPEEINRRLNSLLADLHFAPTAVARDNLLREGVAEEKVFVTGNTVIDALKTTVRPDYSFPDPLLQKVDFQACRVLLVEAHRRENLGSPLEEICLALLDILQSFTDTLLVFPVHKNPAVRSTVYKYLQGHSRALLLEPLDPLSFHNLMARSHLILTDSGGIQEEAPSLGRPVLVLRELTERPEALKAGTALLACTGRKSIVQKASALLQDADAYNSMARAANPYGDGRASERIRDIILHFFGQRSTLPEPFKP
ncbi:MAG: UDP-N-acetylglucosamine 2-epimerase (non-hydrolyzing) [Firmicutes bacterium]|nr:UDP-N-acetylglucosamine 2-epimerase (non-hydrolyzing) [Bacillota bacterium]